MANKTQIKKRLIHAFNAYYEAHRKLNELWGEIGTDKFSKMYPFEKSFDDMECDVELWVQDNINYLETQIKSTD